MIDITVLVVVAIEGLTVLMRSFMRGSADYDCNQIGRNPAEVLFLRSRCSTSASFPSSYTKKQSLWGAGCPRLSSLMDEILGPW